MKMTLEDLARRPTRIAPLTIRKSKFPTTSGSKSCQFLCFFRQPEKTPIFLLTEAKTTASVENWSGFKRHLRNITRKKELNWKQWDFYLNKCRSFCSINFSTLEIKTGSGTKTFASSNDDFIEKWLIDCKSKSLPRNIFLCRNSFSVEPKYCKWTVFKEKNHLNFVFKNALAFYCS